MKPVIIISIAFVLLFIPLEINAEVPNSEYRIVAHSLKSSYGDLVNETHDLVGLSQQALEGTNLFENPKILFNVDKGWEYRSYILTNNAEVEQRLEESETYLTNFQYKNAYDKLLTIGKSFDNFQERQERIIKHLKSASDLEKQYQEDKQFCFIFWCFGLKDTYSVLDPKIENLELKLGIFENKIKKLETSKNSAVQSLHSIELKLKATEIKDLEYQRKLDQYEADRQEKQLQAQIRQEQDEARAKQIEIQNLENLQRQERLQADRIERELQSQLETEERQVILTLAQTNPVLKGIIDGTLDFYIEPIPSYYQVTGIHDAIEAIASSLDRNFMGVDIRRTYNVNSADLNIAWVKDFGKSTLGHAIFKSYVEVELGSDNCNGEWQPYDTNTIKKIMWHEIGHSLGYSHSTDTNNVMYASMDARFYQDVSKTITVQGDWYTFTPFCTSGAISFHAESSRDLDGFDVYAIPNDDPNGFMKSGGHTARFLDTDGESCGSDNVLSITRYCDVGPNAYLHFKNNQSHTIYVTIEMYDRNPSFWPEMNWPSDTFEYDSAYLNWVRNMFN